MKRKLKSIKELASLGPFSENTLRWLVFNASSNGLQALDAIVRVGRRVYVDIDAFDRWIDAQNGAWHG
jgi:hypothetical protein